VSLISACLLIHECVICVCQGVEDEEHPPYYGEDPEIELGGEDEPEEYEYIETPTMEMTGNFRGERWRDDSAVAQNMQVFFKYRKPTLTLGTFLWITQLMAGYAGNHFWVWI